MMSHRKEETPAGGHQSGALEKGTMRAPFSVKTTTTPPKIKGFMIECLLAVAAVPAVLLLAPLLVLTGGRLMGGCGSANTDVPIPSKVFTFFLKRYRNRLLTRRELSRKDSSALDCVDYLLGLVHRRPS